jgi:Lipocalin-like domain
VNTDALPDFVGTWRLVSCEARTASGEVRYPLGQHVVGQLFYDVCGNMSAHVIRADRPAFVSDDPGSGTDAEVRLAFEGHVSYFGTYTVDPSAGTVTHHVRGASYPNWIGHDQIRYYRIDGPHLVLSTPPMVDHGETLEYILIWERT